MPKLFGMPLSNLPIRQIVYLVPYYALLLESPKYHFSQNINITNNQIIYCENAGRKPFLFGDTQILLPFFTPYGIVIAIQSS